MKTICAALAVLAAACDAPGRPPIRGTPPPECSAPTPPGHDDIGSGPAPLGWLVGALPVQQPDCAGPPVQYNATASLTWRDRGQVRFEPIPMRISLQTSTSGATCHVRFTTQVLAAPAGRPGTLEPCDVVAASPAWASLQTFDIALDTLAVDGSQLDLAWPVEWSEGLPEIVDCRGASPVASSSFGLAVVADLSVRLTDWRRMTSISGPALAIGVRIDGS